MRINIYSQSASKMNHPSLCAESAGSVKKKSPKPTSSSPPGRSKSQRVRVPRTLVIQTNFADRRYDGESKPIQTFARE